LILIDKFLNSLEDDKLYFVLLSMVSDNKIITLSKQLLITKNTSNKDIYDYLQFRVELNSFKYNFEIKDNVWFNYREVILGKKLI
jgi:hypothetical protein